VLFIVLLFILKTTSIFKNKETYQRANQENGLIYGDITIENLVNKDTDNDGIPDWKENLYGLDPLKKESTPGIFDNIAIEKLKIQKTSETNEPINTINQLTENLTQTDKFSRELFATIAAASQDGTIDQTMIDQLGTSLAEKIENPAVRKVFLISEIKIINEDNLQSFIDYNNTLNNIYKKYPMNYTVFDVLQKFIIDEENVDPSALKKLDPIVEQTNKIITDMAKMNVPKSILTLHLNFLNSLEKLVENINDMKLYDSDPILAIGAITQYNQNSTNMQLAVNNLTEIIKQKLNN